MNTADKKKLNYHRRMERLRNEYRNTVRAEAREVLDSTDYSLVMMQVISRYVTPEKLI